MKPTQTTIPIPVPIILTFTSQKICKEVDAGHVYFLQDSVGKYPASAYDLLVINGDGCYPCLIMKSVSGSPALSKDWQRIAIGCEDNAFLCIIDVKATLESCPKATDEYDQSQCHPIVLRKYSIPREIVAGNRLFNIS